jgi:hypothetical protein
VASRFELPRRREHLSFSHHAELAALEFPVQEGWLDHATAHRLSVRDLRDELAARRGSSEGVDQPAGRAALERRVRSRRTRSARDEESPARIVNCPHCGERFAV